MDNIISSEKSNKRIDLKKYKINKENKIKNKMDALVNTLRIIALDKHLKKESVLIPSGCEKNGFVAGDHNLGNLLYFLADMLE